MGPSHVKKWQGVPSSYPHSKSNTFEFSKVIIRQICYIKGTPNSSNSNNVFDVSFFGGVNDDYAGSAYDAASPAIYLSSNVKISGGEGRRDLPYTLSL